jgi:hypothetical protein
MRQRSRRHVLLRQYELESSSSQRLATRSEAHEQAHVRMRPRDVEALRRQAGELFAPIIALFSTCDSHEPVLLRANEALYVRLPAGEAKAAGGAAGGSAGGAAGEPGGRPSPHEAVAGAAAAPAQARARARGVGRPLRLGAPRLRHRHASLQRHAPLHRAPRSRQDCMIRQDYVIGQDCVIGQDYRARLCDWARLCDRNVFVTYLSRHGHELRV